MAYLTNQFLVIASTLTLLQDKVGIMVLQTDLGTYPPIENGRQVSLLSSTFKVVKLLNRPEVKT